MTTPAAGRPITLLLSAIGGEGGGVLAGWIVGAARHAGLPVQSTSIPGVAQRTGATTYYLEIHPETIASLGGRRPVMAVYPGVGDVDVMVASEFAEAGRAIANGFVTPDRTLLIASTHRVYAIDERGAMGDGRFDDDRLYAAVAARARMALLDDLRGAAERTGVSLNAMLLGVLAATGTLPLRREDFEQAIRDSGIAVEANLKGFAAGLIHVFPQSRPHATLVAKRGAPETAESLESRVETGFPRLARTTLREGVRRLADYQDPAYAALYLDRMEAAWHAERNAGGDGALTECIGRNLAVRMSYEDVIRVAQLKSAPGRLARVREEVGAKPGEPVIVIDYFKPGIDELCSILPPWAAQPLLALARHRTWVNRAHWGMRVKSTSVLGYARLRLLAGLRRFRRGTWRFGEEQAAITAWLDDCIAACDSDRKLAGEIAECASLIKGYGETHRRGSANFARIRNAVIGPALAGTIPPHRAADAIANARVAALADPEGERLAAILAAAGADPLASAAE